MVSALELFIQERPWFPLVPGPDVARRVPTSRPRAASSTASDRRHRSARSSVVALRPTERDQLKGVVAVMLMGLALDGRPSLRDVSFDSVRWMLRHFWARPSGPPSG